MWGTLAKVGGSILAGLGLEAAFDSYQNQEAEKEQMNKQAKWGKMLLIAAALWLGYSLTLKK